MDIDPKIEKYRKKFSRTRGHGASEYIMENQDGKGG